MNIEFKGTQGEWIEFNGAIYGPKFEGVCSMLGHTTRPIPKANADLITAAPKLLEALTRILDLDCPLTGDPSRERLIEHWEWEQSQGNGAAEDNLFALAVIAEALGETK